ncbi:hypothetical protein Zmor_002108 [Zophobas morio]|uniref:Protein TsetseEP domain-containing protein n=1 Tax=Zophobas morio TaxID=2755281 RepID=A0AA38JAR1_9CUCU|nr:hypothetical protein Zmor_002108 [Zophobas morio]
MFRNILLFIFGALVTAQLCHADAVDDAEAALNVLRQTTIDNLNRGTLEQIKWCTEVDTVALDTKESGLKALEAKTAELILQLKKVRNSTPAKMASCYGTLTRLQQEAADDLETCVNDQADEAVTLISDKGSAVTVQTLKTIYDEEKEIIFCGRSNEECLTGVTADINEKTAAVPDIINDEIEVDRQAVDEQIELIKACAAKVVEKANGFARRCVH